MFVFNFTSELWKHDGPSAWHFVTLPSDMSNEIKVIFKDMSPGFGIMPVNVSVNRIKWKTSLFYDTKLETYLLPVKADVRKRGGLTAGDSVEVEIEVMV